MTTTANAANSSTVEKLAQAVTDLQETVREQAEHIEQQAEKIENLENEVEVQSSNVAGAHNRISDLDGELSELQRDSTDAAAGVNDAEKGTQGDQTPLERICTLPEHIADRELTANQERARFIARDIHDYAEKVPAGLVIDSRAIKRVLTASEGKRPHTQTVARVMDFLDELGKQDIQQKKRRGKKLIIVDPEAANRYHSRCDQGNGETSSERVIRTV